MKKLLFSPMLLILMTAYITAQTSLPTSWDCDPATFPSNGWTTNLINYYNIGSVGYYNSPPASAKFDATGKYVTINFTDSPENLSYYIRGASFSGGTFTIEQSANGSTWTTIATYNNGNISNSSLVNYSHTLNTASRWVRFIYTSKSSGNVAIDDISILPAAAGPEAEIAVKQGSSTIPSGSQFVIGTAPSTAFKLINYGTDSTLSISASNITGTDASMFSISGMPASIGPEDSSTFNIIFAPTGPDGSKFATLSISNNDTDENPYLIDLYGIKGSFATEPTAAATNLQLNNIKSYSYDISFAAATPPPDNYIVLRNIGSSVTDLPIDGSSYLRGEYLGSAQIVYIGQPASFNPVFVAANTSYYYSVFSFNGPEGFENYNTASVLTGNVTTLHDMIGSYYSSINPSSPTFATDLHNLINPHFMQYYSDYDDYLVNDVDSRDTVAGGVSMKVVTCAFSDYQYVYTEPFSWTVFNREHTFCQSWMPTYLYPDFQNRPEYSDYFNLFPVHGTPNSQRSNMPLGDVVTIQQSYGNGKLGLDTAGNQVYEPRDEHKGVAARAMMYMIVCYNSISGNTWVLPDTLSQFAPYGQDEAVLKGWHFQFPPTDRERARNDYIEYVQNNRNPFIDSIYWANLIDFDGHGTSGLFYDSREEFSTSVYPNPSQGNFTVLYNCQIPQKFSLIISDLSGRDVYNCEFEGVRGVNYYRIFTDLPSGIYTVSMKTGEGVKHEKIIIR